MDTAVILDKLNGSLVEVGTWLESTKDFAIEQAPLVVKEILYWGFAVESFELLISFCILGTGVYLIRKAKTHDWYAKFVREELWVFAIGSAWVVFAIGIIATCENALDPIKVMVAPRLYLIEYFRELLHVGGK